MMILSTRPSRGAVSARGLAACRFCTLTLCALVLGVCHSAVWGAAPVEAGASALPDNVFPPSATLVTPDHRDTLQQELDAHQQVRLLPGDYGPGPITLHRGQHLYGLPGTKVGRVIVDPGAAGVLLSGVQTNLTFPASDKVSRANTFLRTSSILVQGGTLEDNLFVDADAVNVDVTTSGYVRNNRFIRAPGQMQGYNILKFRGSLQRPSNGNVFLWFNAGGNEDLTTQIDGVPDLTIAIVDAEMWSYHSKEPTALFTTGALERLNLFAVQGGRYDKDPDVRRKYGLIDSAAREVRVFGLTCGYRGQAPDTQPPKIVLRPGNERSLFVDSLPYSFALPSAETLQIRAFELSRGAAETGLAPNAKTNPNQPFTVTPPGAEQTQQAALKAMIQQTGRQLRPWNRPSAEAVTNPAGDDWAKDLASAPDHTQMLQNRLDQEGMVVLAPGKYYISAPLRINLRHGIIGAGMDQTVIIAKDPNLSMFVYDAQGDTKAVSLANLTLQGGGVGVHLRSADIKTYINKSFLSHLTFRNMAIAGVYIDLGDGNEGSFDNNLISCCNFVKCATGIKQHTPPQGDWGFIDKMVVYRCQFLQCGIGIDLPARRGNNACAFIECRFVENTSRAIGLVHNSTASCANSDFINNAGDPVIASENPVYFLSCRFQAGANARSLLPRQSVAEGCVFESEKSPGNPPSAVVVKNPSRNHFYN
ncbi:MAG: hypothetical protein WCI73_16555, partial [Phycisphaerae bacterium]